MSNAYGASAVMARDLLSRTMGRIVQRRKLPESTYRLQFHSAFTFRDAAVIAPYLRDLGITHVYTSPIFKAQAGSTHGYDVVDHNALNPELGTETDFNAYLEALRAGGLQQIIDVVPNHTAVGVSDNDRWNDVLANGLASSFVTHFDIAWRTSNRAHLYDKVLLPILGEPYGQALDNGLLKLKFEDGRIFIQYHDRQIPISADSSMAIFEKSNTGDIDWAVATYNGKAGAPRSFDLLNELLNQQHYRLAFWKTANDEINYRRFFDITTLAALCVEYEEVFEATHRLLFKMLAAGQVAGVRIDHPDGLYDPRQYFERLQRYYILATARVLFDEAPHQYTAWKQMGPGLLEEVDGLAEEGAKPLYVVVEKILGSEESLPTTWPVYGTTGYDFIEKVNGLFVDSSQAEAFTQICERVTGDSTPFEQLARDAKRLILDHSLTSELEMLLRMVDELAQQSRLTRDFTLRQLRLGLREMIVHFPIYRTYTTATVQPADRALIEQTAKAVIAENPAISQAVIDFIRDMLLLVYPVQSSEDQQAQQRYVAHKFQQLTSPVTAKGVEDTTFYLYSRLISLNEVGCNPGQFGIDPARLHKYFANRQANWPYALSCLSTHDTKRSEDVRARINVLSELPAEWEQSVKRWRTQNEPHRQKTAGGEIPDANEEYFIYQTLIGAWPVEPLATPEQQKDFVSRIQAYMLKSLREGKRHTNWIEPNTPYEQAVLAFVAAIIDESRSPAFHADFLPFQRRISHVGMLNSLSQTLLRIGAPGVPDTYQGTELWDFSLVDPDNRRPVDYAARLRLLRDVGQRLYAAGPDRSALASTLLATKEDGRVKVLVTAMPTRCRRENAGLFSTGQYIPLEVRGSKAGHVFAFARRTENRWAIVAVARLMTSLLSSASALPVGPAVWGDTTVLLPGISATVQFRNVVTGKQIAVGSDGVVPVAELFAHLSVAMLISEGK